jgi:hypothetical protein
VSGGGNRFSSLPAWQRRLLAGAAAGELTLKVAALIDLRRRPGDQVRGPKQLWVALMFVNLIGPLSYFAFGRRR